jgi:hypothetical protein
MASPTPAASVQKRPRPTPVNAREEPEVGPRGAVLPGSEPPVAGEVMGLVVPLDVVVLVVHGIVLVVVVDPGDDVVVEAGAVVEVVDDVLVVVLDGTVLVLVVVLEPPVVVEVEVDVVDPLGVVVLVVDAGTDVVVGLTGRVVVGVPVATHVGRVVGVVFDVVVVVVGAVVVVVAALTGVSDCVIVTNDV